MRILITLLTLIFMFPSYACEQVARVDSLAGSEWLVLEIGELQAKNEAFLQFKSDGKVGGRTGVNSMGGSYTADGSSLSFGPLIMTKMAGPPELMEQESRLVSALERVDGFQRDGVHLTLTADGQPVVTLRQTDWD